MISVYIYALKSHTIHTYTLHEVIKMEIVVSLYFFNLSFGLNDIFSRTFTENEQWNRSNVKKTLEFFSIKRK